MKIPAAGTTADTDDPTGSDQTGDTASAQTGDDSNIFLWIAAMLAAGAAATGAILYGRNRKYGR